jgi:hypothetical protein
MQFIDNILTTSSDPSSKLSLAIRAALAIGKATLDKYYNKTGESEVYAIAMGTFFLFLTISYVSDCEISSPLPSSQVGLFQME